MEKKNFNKFSSQLWPKVGECQDLAFCNYVCMDWKKSENVRISWPTYVDGEKKFKTKYRVSYHHFISITNSRRISGSCILRPTYVYVHICRLKEIEECQDFVTYVHRWNQLSPKVGECPDLSRRRVRILQSLSCISYHQKVGECQNLATNACTSRWR